LVEGFNLSENKVFNSLLNENKGEKKQTQLAYNDIDYSLK
jgi:hypothetical protein